MSWIFGRLQKKNKKYLEPFPALPEERAVFFENKNFQIAVGGNNSNFLFKQEPQCFWVVCGLGIQYSKDGFQFCNHEEWDRIFSTNSELSDLNGHFVTLVWKNEKLTIQNDSLGLRDLFFYENEELLYFSTHLHWLVHCINSRLDFDKKVLANLWKMQFQLDYSCIIEGVYRLKPNGTFLYSAVDRRHTFHYWNPEKKWHYPSVVQELNELVQLSKKEKKPIQLALSGGTDSRTILAFFKHHNIFLHTWGDDRQPDVIIAKKIAQKYTYNFTQIKPILPVKPDDLITKMQAYILMGNMSYLSINCLHLLPYYSSHPFGDSILLDGGHGHFLRRGTFNRLVQFGNKAIMNQDSCKILSILAIDKPDIFNDDISCDFQKHNLENIQNILSQMPSLKTISIENWVDLFSLRYKTGNIASINQNFLDNQIVNYMPFAQISVLNHLFSLPASIKRNSKINKRIFSDYFPELTTFPMEEYGHSVPFFYDYKLAFLLGKILTTLKKPYVSQFKNEILKTSEVFIRDMSASSKALNSEYLDVKKVNRLINGYYEKKKTDNADSLGWILTYLVWENWIHHGYQK
jgi:hypothetical protein